MLEMKQTVFSPFLSASNDIEHTNVIIPKGMVAIQYNSARSETRFGIHARIPTKTQRAILVFKMIDFAFFEIRIYPVLTSTPALKGINYASIQLFHYDDDVRDIDDAQYF